MSGQTRLEALVAAIGADIKTIYLDLSGRRITTTIASSATPTPTGNGMFNELFVTAQADVATFAVPSGTPVDGNSIVIRVHDNGTARVLAYNAIFRAVGVTLPTTTVVGKTTYIGAKYHSVEAKWDVIAVSQEV